MKRLILSSLSLLLLSTIAAPAVKAQPTRAYDPSPQRMTKANMEITPFQLVFLAYQGFLENAGIPKAEQLLSEYDLGRITAKKLVQAGVNLNKLPANRLQDKAYITYVDEQMQALAEDGDR